MMPVRYDNHIVKTEVTEYVGPRYSDFGYRRLIIERVLTLDHVPPEHASTCLFRIQESELRHVTVPNVYTRTLRMPSMG